VDGFPLLSPLSHVCQPCGFFSFKLSEAVRVALARYVAAKQIYGTAVATAVTGFRAVVADIDREMFRSNPALSTPPLLFFLPNMLEMLLKWNMFDDEGKEQLHFERKASGINIPMTPASLNYKFMSSIAVLSLKFPWPVYVVCVSAHNFVSIVV
jgi:hypothetical protein